MNIPPLYKYRYFNEKLVLRAATPNIEQIPQWQHILYDGMFTFASPDTFNDPYDCDFVVEDSFLHEKAARELYIETLKEMRTLTEQDEHMLRTADDWKAILETLLEVPLSSSLGQTLMQSVNDSLRKIKKEFRVACFSATKDSILMWSHYAQNHKGFCIEYDFEKWPLAGYLHPVQYSGPRKHIPGTFANFDGELANKAIYEATLYKSAVWDYEEEWRCVFHRKEINPFPFGRTAFQLKNHIRAVYLGAQAAEKYCTQICEHYRGTDVKVYQMRMQTDRYQLKPEPIQ